MGGLVMMKIKIFVSASTAAAFLISQALWIPGLSADEILTPTQSVKIDDTSASLNQFQDQQAADANLLATMQAQAAAMEGGVSVPSTSSGDGTEAQPINHDHDTEGAGATTTTTGAGAATTVPTYTPWPGPLSDGYYHVTWAVNENNFINNMISAITDAVQKIVAVYQGITTALSAWAANVPIVFEQAVLLSDAQIVIDMLTGADFSAQFGSGYIAYAYYPSSTELGGNVFFNGGPSWRLPGTSSGVDFTATAVHELGHAIGLGHEETSVLSVMDPYIHTGLYTVTDTDPAKTAAQNLYGMGIGQVRSFDPAINDPPLFSPVPSKTVEATNTVSFTINANDPESTPLTYFASNLPSGSTFDPSSRTFTWTPTTSQVGSYTVTFSASDGINVTILDVPITVTEYVYPTIPVIEAINDMTITVGQTIKVPVMVTDPDGLYQITVSGPKGTQLVFEDGIYYVVWTAPSTIKGRIQSKSFNFKVTVTDTKATSASETFTVTVAKTAGALPADLSGYPTFNLSGTMKTNRFILSGGGIGKSKARNFLTVSRNNKPIETNRKSSARP